MRHSTFIVFSVLFDLLKQKYNVPKGASYLKSIELMKKNGISTEELIALHETRGDLIEEPGL